MKNKDDHNPYEPRLLPGMKYEPSSPYEPRQIDPQEWEDCQIHTQIHKKQVRNDPNR